MRVIDHTSKYNCYSCYCEKRGQFYCKRNSSHPALGFVQVVLKKFFIAVVVVCCCKADPMHLIILQYREVTVIRNLW